MSQIITTEMARAIERAYPTADRTKDIVLSNEGSGWLVEAWTVSEDPLTDPLVTAALAEIRWDEIRAKRDSALGRSDLTAIRCFKAGIPFPAEWLAYVKALRDLPQSTDDPTKVVWPERPALPEGS